VFVKPLVSDDSNGILCSPVLIICPFGRTALLVLLQANSSPSLLPGAVLR
jgi:hypothetical protein